MGMCLDGTDRVSCEIRRDSFIIHTKDDARPHLELEWSDLPKLVYALAEMCLYQQQKYGADWLGRLEDVTDGLMGAHQFKPEQAATQFSLAGFLLLETYPFQDGVFA